jgi:hypothetical protein
MPVMSRRFAAPLFMFALMLPAATHAQSLHAADPFLSSLSGTWTGTCTIGERQHPCEWTWTWSLGGAFLEGTLRVWRDASRRGLVFEQRQYLRPAGDRVYAVHCFDSREVALWGEYTGSGTSYPIVLDASDGRRAAGLLEFGAADACSVTLTTSGDAGEVAEVLRMELRKRP